MERTGESGVNRGIRWLKRCMQLCLQDSEIDEINKKSQLSEICLEYSGLKREEQQNIINVLKERVEPDDAIYLLSYILNYMDLQELKEELYLDIMAGNFNCYTSIMLELQFYAVIKGCYVEKRKIRQKNIAMLKKVLGQTGDYQHWHNRNKKRIVIITEQLLSLNHAPTKVVINIAYELCRNLGYEVMFFVCPCDGELPEELWYHSIVMRSAPEYYDKPIQIKYRDVLFNGYQINMRFGNYLKEYAMMLQLIHEWNPCFVFAMGANNPVADLAKEFTTLVSMSMSTECPVSEAQILLRSGRKGLEEEAEYKRALSDGQIQCFIDKMPVTVEQQETEYHRKDEKLPEDRFLIAVVGNRLDIEIDKEFVSVMKQILQENKEAAFGIIGEVEQLKEYFQDSEFDGRIFYMGYRWNLVSTYRLFDIYLNPKRMGGGFSGAMALAAGIPVVTLNGGDVAHNVGEDFVVSDYTGMVSRTKKLINDTDYYNMMKSRALMVAAKNTDHSMTEFVENLMNQILQVIEKQHKK